MAHFDRTGGSKPPGLFINEEKIEAAKRMLERGKMTKEEIAEDLDLPLSVVERLENDLQLA